MQQYWPKSAAASLPRAAKRVPQSGLLLTCTTCLVIAVLLRQEREDKVSARESVLKASQESVAAQQGAAQVSRRHGRYSTLDVSSNKRRCGWLRIRVQQLYGRCTCQHGAILTCHELDVPVMSFPPQRIHWSSPQLHHLRLRLLGWSPPCAPCTSSWVRRRQTTSQALKG
jgi:hypothetical protein